MASDKRRSNARGKRGSGTRGGQGAGGAGLSPVANDILGVCLIVLAIAMAISLLTPTNAPVTRAVGDALGLCFGMGALLCPCALIVYAMTFLIERARQIGTRVAVGLLLVVLGILGLLSINFPGAEQDPFVVLDAGVVSGRGGYVGGAAAWCLLESVGTIVGNVILVGIMVVGVIVCGFSLSGALSKAQERIDAHRNTESTGRRTHTHRLSWTWRSAAPPEVAPVAGPATGNDGVAPLSRRKTSVFRRGQEQDSDTLDDAEEIVDTEPLPRSKKHPPIDEESAVPASHEAREEGENVPDFLKAARPASQGALGSNASPSKADASVRKTRRLDAAPTASSTPSRRRTSPKPAGTAKRPGDGFEDFELPPFSMLSSNPNSANAASTMEELEATKERLQGTLVEFGLTSRVVDYVSGPIVTTFRVEMGEGERVSRIKNLEDDIALTLAAEKVRIFAPIRGTSYVGVEIPNSRRSNVHLGDVLPYAKGGPLEVAIGRDSAGKPVIADIARMPHMLVAGTTGSGKSVLINSMVMSLLMRCTPKQVRLIMIDPKRVEFSSYNGLPHLYVPVVTDPRQATSALSWAVSEMERRLKVFERAGARNISVYNKMCTKGKLAEMDNPPEPLPYIVIVIDELSDLMMTAGKDVEASIVRIAQLARAAGIHLVIATQRPSANVVTGLIKSNIDSRVALKVSSGIDSRVILDETGAERLLGNGDMLFKDRGLAARRVLGCYTSDDEIESVVAFIRDQAEPDYHNEILSQVVPGQPSAAPGEGPDAGDPLVWEAARIVVDSQLGSTSGLQRRLKVGYARAGRIMDMLEAKGVVGPPDGSKPREVLLDKDGLEELMSAEERYGEV